MLEKLNEFTESHGELPPGRGRVTGVIALSHWHHSQDQEALDKNYAAHFAFLDYLFGTADKSTRLWPQSSGVLGDYVPNGFVKQFKFPFSWKG